MKVRPEVGATLTALAIVLSLALVDARARGDIDLSLWAAISPVLLLAAFLALVGAQMVAVWIGARIVRHCRSRRPEPQRVTITAESIADREAREGFARSIGMGADSIAWGNATVRNATVRNEEPGA